SRASPRIRRQLVTPRVSQRRCSPEAAHTACWYDPEVADEANSYSGRRKSGVFWRPHKKAGNHAVLRMVKLNKPRIVAYRVSQPQIGVDRSRPARLARPLSVTIKDIPAQSAGRIGTVSRKTRNETDLSPAIRPSRSAGPWQHTGLGWRHLHAGASRWIEGRHCCLRRP